jgi:hypothetical protein
MNKPEKIKKETIYENISIDYGVSASSLINTLNDSIAIVRQKAEKEFNKKIKGKDITVEITNNGMYEEEDYCLELFVTFEIDNPNYEFEMKQYSEYIDRVLEETKETRAWLDRENKAGERNMKKWAQ